jgi:SAM-dependent methyltransferase
MKHGPKSYLGVDIIDGPGVDELCEAERLVSKFGEEAFDLIICTEVVEHTRHWRDVINNIKSVCAPGGTIVITTRSFGFPFHGWPYDYWRYECGDMERIFSDCDILRNERDPGSAGVFVKVKKPLHFRQADLSGIALYSIIAGKRISSISSRDLRFHPGSLHLRSFLVRRRRQLKQWLARRPLLWRLVVPSHRKPATQVELQ